LFHLFKCIILTVIKSIPKLRFQTFKDEWVTKKLDSIATFSKGKNISKADISEDGMFECIRYGQLYTDYGEVIKKVLSRTSLKKSKLIFSEKNDIIIPASGETQFDIAKASCVLKEGVALGGDLNIIKTKMDGVFLSYYLNYTKRIDIAKMAQGNSVVHLYAIQLKSLQINLPSLSEQQKIAAFLTAVDDKIQQIIRKKKLLEQYKKGCMQQVFSQVIQFKNGSKAYPSWNKKIISDFAPLQRGFDLPVDKIKTGEYPVVFSNGILKNHNEFKVWAPGVVTGRSGTIGKVTYVEQNYWPHNTSLWVTDFKNNYPKYVYYFFLNLGLERFASGSGVPTLNRNDVHSQSALFPSLEEQQKIANFLSTIDTKINLVETQLKKTQEFKKGLLQQMFI
jgi:type I restriction enzyme S subunit